MDNRTDIPQVLADFADAQNDHNAEALALTFSEKGVVHDEGRDYSGRDEIRKWSELANSRYQTKLKVLGFETSEKTNLLTVEVSGTFDGSPLTLFYHFEITDNLITSLKITSKKTDAR